jgi:hypothetical protein
MVVDGEVSAEDVGRRGADSGCSGSGGEAAAERVRSSLFAAVGEEGELVGDISISCGAGVDGEVAAATVTAGTTNSAGAVAVRVAAVAVGVGLEEIDAEGEEENEEDEEDEDGLDCLGGGEVGSGAAIATDGESAKASQKPRGRPCTGPSLAFSLTLFSFSLPLSLFLFRFLSLVLFLSSALPLFLSFSLSSFCSALFPLPAQDRSRFARSRSSPALNASLFCGDARSRAAYCGRDRNSSRLALLRRAPRAQGRGQIDKGGGRSWGAAAADAAATKGTTART